MKKVLLFLIDSMMPEVLERCVDKKKAPAFQFLMERGQYMAECTTVFPTMTASIDCSLITGVYPDQHKVPGLIWYDSTSKKIINYINGAIPIAKIGFEQCAHNVLFDLNELHLSKEVKTIHEVLEEHGLTSGSINVIAHRGHKRHKASIPFMLNAATGFRFKQKVSGPTILSLGTLVKPGIFRPITWNWSHTMPSAYGVNDAYAIDVLIEVLRSGKQPDFTLTYMPDNDHKLHRTPEKAEEHLAAVDEQLCRLLDSFSSWEQAIEKNVIILISDHGQTIVGQSDEHNIDLEQLLADFHIHRLSRGVSPSDEVVICNNERMAYLYPIADGSLSSVVEAAAVDERLDIIAWKEAEWIVVRKGGTDQEVRFRKGGVLHDCYGVAWTIQGFQSVLDLRIDQHGVVSFHDYPDALNRLFGALFAQPDPVVVVTAAPGYELLSESSPTHLGGGSHGSLHRQDSLIPLVIAGTNRKFTQPARLVDVKSFILQELAVPSVSG